MSSITVLLMKKRGIAIYTAIDLVGRGSTVPGGRSGCRLIWDLFCALCNTYCYEYHYSQVGINRHGDV